MRDVTKDAPKSSEPSTIGIPSIRVSLYTPDQSSSEAVFAPPPPRSPPPAYDNDGDYERRLEGFSGQEAGESQATKCPLDPITREIQARTTASGGETVAGGREQGGGAAECEVVVEAMWDGSFDEFFDSIRR